MLKRARRFALLAAGVWLAAGLAGCGDDADRAGSDAAAPAATTPSATPSAAKTADAELADRSPRALARVFLEGSQPQNQYSSIQDPVWKARTALGVALADDPAAALESALAAAQERFTGFGSTAEHARVMGLTAVVAHYLDDAALEATALAQVDGLHEAAFDQQEADGVQTARLLTLARMAQKPGSSRSAELERQLQAMIDGATEAPAAAWTELLAYYMDHPDADTLARIVIARRDARAADAVVGRCRGARQRRITTPPAHPGGCVRSSA